MKEQTKELPNQKCILLCQKLQMCPFVIPALWRHVIINFHNTETENEDESVQKKAYLYWTNKKVTSDF